MGLIGIIETNRVVAAQWRARLQSEGWNSRDWPCLPDTGVLSADGASWPAVWLVNLGLGQRSGIEAADGLIRSLGYKVPVLMYTGLPSVSAGETRLAYESGAWGLLCGTQSWSAAHGWLRNVLRTAGRPIMSRGRQSSVKPFSPLLGLHSQVHAQNPSSNWAVHSAGDQRCIMGFVAAASAVSPGHVDQLRRWAERAYTLSCWAGHSPSQAQAARLAVLAQAVYLLWPTALEDDESERVEILGAPSAPLALLSALSPELARTAATIRRRIGHPASSPPRTPEFIEPDLPETLQVALLARSLNLLLDDWQPGYPIPTRRRPLVARWIGQCLDSTCARRLLRRVAAHPITLSP